jgi:hypothetical protein
LIEAWASLKSFKKKETGKTPPPPADPGNPTVNFHGEPRSNETHESTTDPQARLYRKGHQRIRLDMRSFKHGQYPFSHDGSAEAPTASANPLPFSASLAKPKSSGLN